MSEPLSFRDLDIEDGEWSDHWKSSVPFRAAWAVINDKSLGGETERSDAFLYWKNQVLDKLLQYREANTRVQRMNTLLYKGKHFFSQRDFYALAYNRGRRYDKEQAKVVLNYLGQAVDQHVSDMSTYEPNLTVTPSNDEEQDRASARMNKQVLDYYLYELKLKTAFQTFHKRKKIHGETFMFVDWDKDIGDFHPKYKELRRMRQEQGQDPDMPIPLIDPTTGNPLIGEDGNPLFITQSVRVGDIKIEQEYSERVLYPYPESGLWCDVPWLIRLMYMDVDEVKAMNPKYAEMIKADSQFRRYANAHPKSTTSKVCVRYFYHKPTRFLDRGYSCLSTESVILQKGVKLYNHDELPCIRGTDIDVPFEVCGMSFIQNLAMLNHAINNSTSMILQNQSLFAYPKYVVPRGAKVKYSDLGDERGIYEYSGVKAPEIVATNSTPPDTFKVTDMMYDKFKTLSGIYDTSRGNAPDGITANVALRMIDEQERKFHKPSIDKHGENVELLGKLILSTLGTYRDPSDEALIKIVGKNNERYLSLFDVANLNRSYEVKLIRSSGLPENPAAKTQTVLDLADRFEGLWSPDEILEYLDIHRPEKLVESATVSRQAAESEVEDILSGVASVLPPSPYHDILPKYRVYEKAVQSRAFDEADPVVKQRMLNHIITAEYLITRKMKLNPLFAQMVMQKHPNFPMFFPLAPAPIEQLLLPQPPQPGMIAGMPGADPLGGISPEAAASAPQVLPSRQIPPNQPPIPQNIPAEGEVPSAGSLP